jgi:hypothetical protein
MVGPIPLHGVDRVGRVEAHEQVICILVFLIRIEAESIRKARPQSPGIIVPAYRGATVEREAF